MRIVDLIMRFETHSENARDGVEKDVSDYFVYNGFPSTYREIFELLHNHKIINKETFESIKRLIFLRNLISHEYHKITKDELIEMVDLLKEAEKFIEKVKEGQK